MFCRKYPGFILKTRRFLTRGCQLFAQLFYQIQLFLQPGFSRTQQLTAGFVRVDNIGFQRQYTVTSFVQLILQLLYVLLRSLSRSCLLLQYRAFFPLSLNPGLHFT